MADIDEPHSRKIGRASAPHELVQAAELMVNNGTLPREDTGRILAGPGESRPCSLCSDAIESADVEYEMTCGNANSYRFHIACYFAWKQVASANGGGGNG